MSRKLYMIEGIDGVGKSTLVDALKCKHAEAGDDVHVLHAEKPKTTSWINEYLRPLLIDDAVVICDRWHVGEWVWPFLLDPTRQRRPILGPRDVKVLDHILEQFFESYACWYLVRDHAGVTSCRELDYSYKSALDLYDGALFRTGLIWDVGTLPEAAKELNVNVRI